jgi:hypothetical protein
VLQRIHLSNIFFGGGGISYNVSEAENVMSDRRTLEQIAVVSFTVLHQFRFLRAIIFIVVSVSLV